MGVSTYEKKITSSVPPAKMLKGAALDSSVPRHKMFKGAVPDADKLIPKVRPQAVKCVETIQGEGGPGSIKKISKVSKSYKKVEILQGQGGPETIKKISRGSKSYKSEEILVVASPNGGFIYKNTKKYHTKGDVEISKERVKGSQELIKAMAACRLDPDAY